jgi:hypothetical protein
LIALLARINFAFACLFLCGPAVPKKKAFSDVLYVRGLEHRADILNAIDEKHGIAPVELARRLVEAACSFYETHGWFSFPVVIEPEAFQARFVAETQAAYLADKRATSKRPREDRPPAAK